MQAFIDELLDPWSIFAHLSYIFLITSMLMRDLRYLRILALLSGLAAIAHFTFQTRDWASMTWEVLFVLANGSQLAILLYRSRSKQMLREETQLLEQVLQVQNPADQRRLLGLLHWRDVPVGEVLVKQGEASPPLIYISSGAAGIESDGKLIGVCGQGDFLGEMSLISGNAASASVVVTNPMRIARFEPGALRELSQAVPELGRAIDGALGRGLAAKVLRMNEAAAAN